MRRIMLFMLLACTSIVGFAKGNTYRDRGYKGDATLGVNADISCGGSGIGIFTTHGYQFNKTWFLGGGIGYENEMFPLYLDGKAYFLKRNMKVNPWAELKLGYDVVNCDFYISPSVGVALPFAKDYAITLALAWGCDVYYGENNIGLRVGFQF